MNIARAYGLSFYLILRLLIANQTAHLGSVPPSHHASASFMRLDPGLASCDARLDRMCGFTRSGTGVDLLGCSHEW
jgi:hypothetical protein